MTDVSTLSGRLSDFEKAHAAATRRRSLTGLVGFLSILAVTGWSVWIADFSLRSLIDGAPRIGNFFAGLIPPLRLSSFSSDFTSWYWGFAHWLYLLWVTLMIALIGTTFGTFFGLLLGLLATRRFGAGPVWAWVARRTLEIARTVPDLVWALIFVFSFGLGPLAGALAIFMHSTGAQGKLFADVNENVDPGPLEGVRASGGTWLDSMVIGLVPQVAPNYVSFTLWRLELNVRSATVIGFVGAGGIGMALYEALSLTYYDDAGAILLMVFATVIAIDNLSEWLRTRIAGHDRRPT